MPPVYATAEDFEDWAGEAGPADIDRRLARASEAVAQATKTAVYDIDDDDLPTDAELAEALKTATCAQAAWWIETGDESGAGERFQTVTIGRVSLGRGAAGRPPRSTAGEDMGPQARTILDLAGLLGGETQS